jgi:ABC-type branched-subunit amino acid transport system substrate-binding protein
LELGSDMLLDEQCDPNVAAAHTRRLGTLPRSIRPIAVIGPYCSGAATGALPLSKLYKQPFITAAASSILFNNRSLYPYFLRMNPSLGEDCVVALQLVRYYGWKRITVLGTNDNYGGSGADRIQALATKAGVSVVPTPRWTRFSNVSVVEAILTPLKAANVRIIILFVHADTLQVVMQAAVNIGYYGPGIVYYMAANTAWTVPNANLAPVADGMLMVRFTQYNHSAIEQWKQSYRAYNFPNEPLPDVFSA